MLRLPYRGTSHPLDVIHRVATRNACTDGLRWPELTERQRNMLLTFANNEISRAVLFARHVWPDEPVPVIKSWAELDCLVGLVAHKRRKAMYAAREAYSHHRALTGEPWLTVETRP